MLDRILKDCGLSETSTTGPHLTSKSVHIEDASRSDSQSRLNQGAIINTSEVNQSIEAAESDTTSFEIITDKPAVHKPANNRQKSCWTRAIESDLDTAPMWDPSDSSPHDVEKYGPLHRPISLRNLPARLPRDRSSVNAGATNARSSRLARGNVGEEVMKSSPTSEGNSRRLERTNRNFPPLPLSREVHKNEHTDQEVKINAQEIPSSTHSATAAPIADQVGDHSTPDKPRSMTPNGKLRAAPADIKHGTDHSDGMVDAIGATSKILLAPHLRPSLDAFKEDKSTSMNIENQALDYPDSPSDERHDDAQKDFLKYMVAQNPKWSNRHATRTPKSGTPMSQATQPVTPVHKNLPATSKLSNVKSPTFLEHGNQVNNSNDKRKFKTPPQQSLSMVDSATPCKKSSPFTIVSAAALRPMHKNRPAKNDIGPFPWIEGEEDTGLQGWDNKMKPAPVGDEWDLRDTYNSTDANRKAVVEAWANDQSNGQVKNSVQIDVNSAEFLTGEGVIEDDIGLQRGIEASLHHAIPDRTTVHEPKRQATTEDVIKEHVRRHDFPSSEAIQEKQDPVRGRLSL